GRQDAHLARALGLPEPERVLHPVHRRLGALPLLAVGLRGDGQGHAVRRGRGGVVSDKTAMLILRGEGVDMSDPRMKEMFERFVKWTEELAARGVLHGVEGLV